MEIETVSDPIEKQIVIGLITSSDYSKQIIPILELNLFESTMCRIVAGWCIEYFKKYGDVPGKEIKYIYQDKMKSIKNKTQRKLTRIFIKRINRNYSELGFNIDYIFKRTRNYIRERTLKQKIGVINSYLESGDVDKAEEQWFDTIRFSGYEDLGFNPLDTKDIDRAFSRDENFRVKIGTGIEALDRIAGKAKSGWLCAYIAPTKRGKTFSLWHTAIAAYLRGLNVVFISLETEEEDNALRFWSGLGSLSTVESNRLKFPYFANDEKTKVKHKKVRRPLIGSSSVKRVVKVTQKMGGGRIRIKRYPMKGGSVSDFERYLDMLEVYDNFSAHLIIVDYLGIIKPPSGVSGRDSYDTNSQLLKSLAQKKDCVVFTGHQATRRTLDMDTYGSEETSEDIRVIANLDIGYSINQTEAEKELLQNRYGVIAHRHKYFTVYRQAKNLIQLEAGQTSLDSRVIKIEPKTKNKKGDD